MEDKRDVARPERIVGTVFKEEKQKPAIRRNRECLEERTFRLANRRANARLSRFKDATLFCVALIFAIAVAASALYVVLSPSPSQAQTTWATASLAALISGVLGYLTGRANKQG